MNRPKASLLARVWGYCLGERHKGKSGSDDDRCFQKNCCVHSPAVCRLREHRVGGDEALGLSKEAAASLESVRARQHNSKATEEVTQRNSRIFILSLLK